MIHIERSKDGKGRYTLLSDRLLSELPKPSNLEALKPNSHRH